MKTSFITFLFFAALLSVAAQSVTEIPSQKFVLSNGLTLIVHEDHKAPIVAVNIWYHVGSKNEKPGKTGFAHLFEHLMFSGSEHCNDDYVKMLARIGATDLNGTTNEDRTNYFQNVPVSALDTVLWMESDRMGHLLGVINQPRLDAQRGVVQNEKRQYDNQPYGRVEYLITESVYPRGHPYSWPVIGSMEDLNAASLDDVREWFRTYYGPSNAVLVIAGDVGAADVKARVDRFFGDIPPGPPLARHEAWIEKRTGNQRQKLEDRVPQARLYQVWNTPPWGTPDDVLLDLVGRVLAVGKFSRLYKRLVFDEQIATNVAAFQRSRELGGIFEIIATAKPSGDLAAVERAVNEELARFLEKGPTADEIDRAKTGLLAGFIRGVERIGGMGGKSDVLAQGQVFAGSPDAYKARFEHIRSATTGDVWAAAKRWLADGVYVLEVNPFPGFAAGSASIDRSVRPEPVSPPAPQFPAFQHATLANGLKLIVAERHAVPIIDFRLQVDAGFVSDAGIKLGTARLAADMLTEGTSTRNALEISEDLAGVGAVLRVSSNVDNTNVNLSVLAEKLDPALEIFADIVQHPAFKEAGLQRVRKLQLAAIAREKSRPNSMAQRVGMQLLYGRGHPYAVPESGYGPMAVLEKLTRDDLERWHTTWFKPNNATLIVVGDTNLAELQPKLERLFASWRPGTVPSKTIPKVDLPATRELYLIDRPGADQSVIFAAQLAPPKANPQEPVLEVLNGILGGQFISRLNMNLREGKHWSYGAFTNISDARAQRPLCAIAPVQTDKTREAVLEVLAEFRGMQGARPFTTEELHLARNSLALTLAGQWETSAAVLGSIADIERFGLADRYYETYAQRIAGVSLADLDKASELLMPDRLLWVIVGDRVKIEAGLRELNLGPVRVVDADGTPAAERPVPVAKQAPAGESQSSSLRP